MPSLMVRTALVVGACCMLGVVGIVAENRHRQLARAAARAQERVAALELALQAERRRTGEACPPAPAAELERVRAAPPTADRDALTMATAAAARAEARAALLAAARGGGPGEDAAPVTAVEALGAARTVLREALAAEEPGWCACPPLPNVTQLCRAAGQSGGSCAEAASVRAEVDALRLALLEANARAQQASEAAVEATARAAAARRQHTA
jgi:hypothetical protein